MVGAVGFVPCSFDRAVKAGIETSHYSLSDTSTLLADTTADVHDKVAKKQPGRKKLKVKITTRIKASEIDNCPVVKTCFTTKPPFIVTQLSDMKENDLAGSYVSVSRLRGPPGFV